MYRLSPSPLFNKFPNFRPIRTRNSISSYTVPNRRGLKEEWSIEERSGIRSALIRMYLAVELKISHSSLWGVILMPITHRWVSSVRWKLAAGYTTITRLTRARCRVQDGDEVAFPLTNRFCRATDVDWTRSPTENLEPPPFVPRSIHELLLRFVDFRANRLRRW